MAANDVAMGMVLASQTVVGILGNSSLLYHYLFLYFTQSKLRSTDFILKNLIIANFLTLLCTGVPQTMAAFGLKDFVSDLGCKLLFYLHRVGRGVSIGSTCFLSVFQAITISPTDSRLSGLKVKAPKYIGSSVYLNWILHIFINTVFHIYMPGEWSDKNITNLKDTVYCASFRHVKTSDILYALFLSLFDVVCVGLMLWASSSMVFILYRHKQRMRQVPRTKGSPRSSPETRATKTILLLVCTFVYFYTLSCIFQVFLALIYNANWFLVQTATVINVCFPTLSPFLLMRCDTSASRSCFP